MIYLYWFTIPIFFFSFLIYKNTSMLFLVFVTGILYLILMPKYSPTKWSFHSFGHFVIFGVASSCGMAMGANVYSTFGAHRQFEEMAGIIPIFALFYFLGIVLLSIIINIIVKIFKEKKEASQKLA